MSMILTDAQRLLLSRFSDGLARAGRGELVSGAFLSPSDRALLERTAKEQGVLDCLVFFGGYPDAERCRLFILPAYLADFEGTAAEKLQEHFAEELEEAICPLLICGSGYRALSHRDHLGSILSLGLERDALGDIVLLDDHSAVIFCGKRIGTFLSQTLERVANDKVTLSAFTVDRHFAPKQTTQKITDTVASDRLDCIVAALTNLSREKAQALIRTGLCQVNYLPEDRTDLSLTPPTVLTIRGFGKFNLLSFDGETKKGRLRMSAEKFI